jgi:hypothetical protein
MLIEKGTYPEVETLCLGADDLTVHQPDNSFHLIWILKFLIPHQVGQEGIDHILLSKSLSSVPPFLAKDISRGRKTYTFKSSKRKSMFRITGHILFSL